MTYKFNKLYNINETVIKKRIVNIENSKQSFIFKKVYPKPPDYQKFFCFLNYVSKFKIKICEVCKI